MTILKKDYNPDIVLIEPTGIAFPQIIKNEIDLMELKDTTIQPLVTLIDGSRFKQLMKEAKNFAMRQIIDAEILCINKIDLVEEIRIPILRLLFSS
ncbi:MAG: GTP-binding protein [Methanolobus sp.]